ncbi:MAG TPA: hypothetical protein PKW42_07595, partial [bacterium]|nr:hypothetical protein [bacterium]
PVVANPYVRAFRKAYSFLTVDMEEGRVVVRAVDSSGKTIDTATLLPRAVEPPVRAPSESVLSLPVATSAGS